MANTKTDNPKLQQLPSIRVDDELWAAIQKDAAATFEGIPEIVRRRLMIGFAVVEELTKSAAQVIRERKEQLQIEALEREAAVARKEMIRIDDVAAVVEKDYGQIRQEVNSIAQSAGIELGLSEDDTRKLADLIQAKTMPTLSGELKETYVDIVESQRK